MTKLRMAIVVICSTACVGTASPVSTTTAPSSTATSEPSVTTTIADSTTTSVESTDFPELELPVDATCAIDDVPDSGEATVVVDGRLYGLGTDGMSPRCLADGIATADVEWAPKGDRALIGSEVMSATGSVAVPPASGYVWSAPTGSRVLAWTTDRLWKVDPGDLAEVDITFLSQTAAAAYHPAGEHVLVVGTGPDGQYGLWLATNQGEGPLLLASDERATLSDPTWTWLGEPLFTAEHLDGPWHIHRVELTPDGALEGPIIVETDQAIDMLVPAKHDPIMLAYRIGGQPGEQCVEGAHVAVKGVDVPPPVAAMTSAPIGWLSTERLLVMTYPDGCGAPGDLWSFSAGFCPGSEYGVAPIISGIDGAAARESAPPPPPPPGFAGIIDPAPA